MSWFNNPVLKKEKAVAAKPEVKRKKAMDSVAHKTSRSTGNVRHSTVQPGEKHNFSDWVSKQRGQEYEKHLLPHIEQRLSHLPEGREKEERMLYPLDIIHLKLDQL